MGDEDAGQEERARDADERNQEIKRFLPDREFRFFYRGSIDQNTEGQSEEQKTCFNHANHNTRFPSGCQSFATTTTSGFFI